MKRDAKVILLNDSGRFAEAASLLIPHLSKILGSANKDKEILEILKKNMDRKTFEEFCKKDFGTEETPENDDYKVYRDYFARFLKLAKEKSENVKTVTLNSLEAELEKSVAS